MKNKEKQADEILRSYAEELTKEAGRFMNGKEESENRIIVYKTRKKTLNKRVSMICALCIVFIAGALSVSTAEASLGEIFELIFHHNDNNTEIVSDTKPPVKNILHPTYIPEGYESISETEIPGGVELVYANDKDEILCINQIEKDASYASVDIEESEYELCFVNQSQAYFYNFDGNNYLIWQKENMYFEITSTFGKEIMIRIGESLS